MLSIRNIYVIWKRELKGFFYTPLAYVFIGIFTILMGIMFSSFLYTYQKVTQASQFGQGQSITIDRLAEAFYGNMHLILLFLLPFFTMRLFTEESRQNTLALLMTSPIRPIEIVLAKFKAAATVVLVMLAITLIFPVFLILYAAKTTGGPDLAVIFSTYLGLFLACLCYLGFGMFWSSVTDSPLIAVVMAFATNFSFWLLSLAGQAGGTGMVTDVLKHLAINEQFMTFARGSLEIQSFVYFVSLIGLAIFLTNQSLESRAWRS